MHPGQHGCIERPLCKGCDSYLSESLDLLAVFFRLGAGILHSIAKAVQLVHGTPKLAASHRTFAPALQRLTLFCVGFGGDEETNLS